MNPRCQQGEVGHEVGATCGERLAGGFLLWRVRVFNARDACERSIRGHGGGDGYLLKSNSPAEGAATGAGAGAGAGAVGAGLGCVEA